MDLNNNVIMIAVLLFVFAIGFFIINFIMSSVTEQMVNIPVINESEGAVESIEGINNVTGRLDYLLFGLFIALVLALIVGAFFAAYHPVFMFIYFIIVVMAVVASTIFSNVWVNVSQSSIFGDNIVSFPITNNLLTYLPVYMAVVGILGLFVMFIRRSQKESNI